WYFNGTNALTDATSSSVIMTNVQPTNAGSFVVVVANGYGAATSAVASLTILVPPSITQQPMSLTVTQGATAGFTVTASGSPALGYQWFLGSGAVAEATNANLNLNNVQASQAGNYKVVVSNGVRSEERRVGSVRVVGPS